MLGALRRKVAIGGSSASVSGKAIRPIISASRVSVNVGEEILLLQPRGIAHVRNFSHLILPGCSVGLAKTRDVFFSIQSETIMQKSCRAFSSGDGTSTPVFQFSAHSYWIPACKWHNTSPLHLLSSSYDGKVMLWDLRTAEKPTTLDYGPRTICRRHIMTSSYIYECLWEALQQRIRMITCN